MFRSFRTAREHPLVPCLVLRRGNRHPLMSTCHFLTLTSPLDGYSDVRSHPRAKFLKKTFSQVLV